MTDCFGTRQIMKRRPVKKKMRRKFEEGRKGRNKRMERELNKATKKKQMEAAEQKGGPKIERSLLDSVSSSDENEADLSGDDYAAFGEVRSKKNLE